MTTTVGIREVTRHTSQVVHRAAAPGPDAIHPATAEELSSALSAFVTYDKRLAEAARARGLQVATPA
jgi:predicted nucleic acid-binding protein